MAETSNTEMTEKDRQTALSASLAANVPSFAKGDGKLGLEDVQRYVRPPRVIVRHHQVRQETLKQFDPGSVVMVPPGQLVAAPNEPFYVTPVFFYEEFVEWFPLGNNPAIKARSLDRQSEIAGRCLDLAKSKYKDEATGKQIRATNHLNFVCVLHGDSENPKPFIMSFARTRFKAGRSWLELINARETALFAGVYELRSRPDSNEQGEWFTLTVNNPDPESGVSPWVDEAVYAKLKAEHVKFKKAYEDQVLQASYDYEDDAEASPVAEPEQGGEF
jgi:hypothetical protein